MFGEGRGEEKQVRGQVEESSNDLLFREEKVFNFKTDFESCGRRKVEERELERNEVVSELSKTDNTKANSNSSFVLTPLNQLTKQLFRM